jgi:catechol 2,3-dioxygenase-like lactoylglutathione lyase family enzyme
MHTTVATRLFCFLIVSALLISSHAAFSQLTPTNEIGVTMGHAHILAPDPESHKKFWVDVFGAEIAHAGTLELLKLPGIIILISKGQTSTATGTPVLDHFALVVRDLAATQKKLASANIQMADGGGIAIFPDGVRVELLEDKTISVPVAFHHFHIYTGDVESIRSWYTKTFGSVKFPAGAGFPGGEIRFTAQANVQRVPSKGHPIDHISFEVKGLKEFCKKLEAQGVKLDLAYLEAPQIGLNIAFVTDPVGTRIELTEGFAGK